MDAFDLERLERLVEPLTKFFYALMLVALASVFVGSPESALFFLVVGAAAQVVRTAIQELAWQRQDRSGAPTAARLKQRGAAADPRRRTPSRVPAARQSASGGRPRDRAPRRAATLGSSRSS